MPILMVTGQKPIKKSKQGRFQILDVVDMMGPITKYHPPAGLVGQYPEPRARGLPPRRGGEARRVHIEFPEDIADEHTDRCR
jgi:acetolactate synthase-1/2/3 large subunit